LLSEIPVLGQVLFNNRITVYLMFVLVPLLWYVLFRTKLGLRARAVGEHPLAADTVGINVGKTRFWWVTLGGLLAGLGGATLTIPAGTRIEATGGTASYIAIAQDGLLYVNGTSTNPVVMTSGNAVKATGDWGGLVICGRANTNKGGSTGQTATSEVGLATNASIINKVRFLQLTIYRRTRVSTFDPLAPRFDLTRIGHETIELWYAPNNSPVQVITSGTATRASSSAASVAVTSDTAGTVYWMLLANNSAAPTVLQLIGQGAQTGLVGTNKGVEALSSLAASLSLGTLTAVVYQLYYVVVSDQTISSVQVVQVAAS
jgi:hypothetical protein